MLAATTTASASEPCVVQDLEVTTSGWATDTAPGILYEVLGTVRGDDCSWVEILVDAYPLEPTFLQVELASTSREFVVSGLLEVEAAFTEQADAVLISTAVWPHSADPHEADGFAFEEDVVPLSRVEQRPQVASWLAVAWPEPEYGVTWVGVENELVAGSPADARLVCAQPCAVTEDTDRLDVQSTPLSLVDGVTFNWLELPACAHTTFVVCEVLGDSDAGAPSVDSQRQVIVAARPEDQGELSWEQVSELQAAAADVFAEVALDELSKLAELGEEAHGIHELVGMEELEAVGLAGLGVDVRGGGRASVYLKGLMYGPKASEVPGMPGTGGEGDGSTGGKSTGGGLTGGGGVPTLPGGVGAGPGWGGLIDTMLAGGSGLPSDPWSGASRAFLVGGMVRGMSAPRGKGSLGASGAMGGDKGGDGTDPNGGATSGFFGTMWSKLGSKITWDQYEMVGALADKTSAARNAAYFGAKQAAGGAFGFVVGTLQLTVYLVKTGARANAGKGVNTVSNASKNKTTKASKTYDPKKHGSPVDVCGAQGGNMTERTACIDALNPKYFLEKCKDGKSDAWCKKRAKEYCGDAKYKSSDSCKNYSSSTSGGGSSSGSTKLCPPGEICNDTGGPGTMPKGATPAQIRSRFCGGTDPLAKPTAGQSKCGMMKQVYMVSERTMLTRAQCMQSDCTHLEPTFASRAIPRSASCPPGARCTAPDATN